MVSIEDAFDYWEREKDFEVYYYLKETGAMPEEIKAIFHKEAAFDLYEKQTREKYYSKN